MTDDEKIPIPEKFRASIDPADEEAFARLKAADAEQAELATRINSPFLKASPNDVQRSKAFITIETLSQVKRTKEQNEQFAECWATVGRPDVAIAVTKDRIAKKRYKAILEAIERDDNDTCIHAPHHKFVKARIFSLKHGREKSLVRCNVPGCGFENVTSTPEHVKTHNQSQSAMQGKTKGMSISEAKDFHG